MYSDLYWNRAFENPSFTATHLACLLWLSRRAYRVVVVLFYVLFVSIVLFYVLFVCKCVLYYCHQVSTQLQLTNISYHIISDAVCRIRNATEQCASPSSLYATDPFFDPSAHTIIHYALVRRSGCPTVRPHTRSIAHGTDRRGNI